MFTECQLLGELKSRKVAIWHIVGGMEKFLPFLKEHAGTSVVSELIDGLELNSSTMSRYLNGERKMPVSVVIALADKYDFPLLDGMVAAEFLTNEQANHEKERYGLITTSDKDLAGEVLRRLEAVSASLLDDEEWEEDEEIEDKVLSFPEPPSPQELAEIALADIPEGTLLAAREERELKPGEERGTEYYE